MKVILICWLVLLLSLQSLAEPVVVGIASFYGKRHQGRKTASGSIFDPNQLTAASRTLPFGTRVKVTCLRTGQWAYVTITDRGPYVKKRLLDLAPAVAKLLGVKPDGLIRIEMEVQ